ncbi:MAG: helix-turn-helix transcriptional regulator [Calditrichaeota bacterium]|nr:helix-turn-helix transcriptional regulator [Calditrichota bacterium]
MSENDTSRNQKEQKEPVDTLTPYLAKYSLGEKIRRLRLQKSMGLVELGRHTGLSAAMLSKLENGHVVPTLQTLSRIALVFSVGLDHFFADPMQHKKVSVTRSTERLRFDEKCNGKDLMYTFECLDYNATERKSSAYLATIEATENDKCAKHSHNGHEFIYVLEGSLELRLEEEEVTLNAGDTAYFDASLPHSYRSITSAGSKAIVVTVS